MPLKIIFRCSFAVWAAIAVTLAVYLLVLQPAAPWIGVLLAGLAPLVNMVWPYDRRRSPHHKVKLPVVSLLVLLALAWVLLTVDQRGAALWLALGCVGGFLLDTYWASAPDAPALR